MNSLPEKIKFDKEMNFIQQNNKEKSSIYRKSFSCDKLHEYDNIMKNLSSKDYRDLQTRYDLASSNHCTPQINRMDLSTFRDTQHNNHHNRFHVCSKKSRPRTSSSTDNINKEKDYDEHNKDNYNKGSKSKVKLMNHNLVSYPVEDLFQYSIDKQKSSKSYGNSFKYDNFLETSVHVNMAKLQSIKDAKSQSQTIPFYKNGSNRGEKYLESDNQKQNKNNSLMNTTKTKFMNSKSNVVMCTENKCNYTNVSNDKLQAHVSRKWYRDLLIDKRELELRQSSDLKFFHSDPYVVKLKASYNVIEKNDYTNSFVEALLLLKLRNKLYFVYQKHHDTEILVFRKEIEEWQQNRNAKIRHNFILEAFRADAQFKTTKMIKMLSNILILKEKYYYKESYDIISSSFQKIYHHGKATNLRNCFKFHVFLNQDMRAYLNNASDRKELKGWDAHCNFETKMKQSLLVKLRAVLDTNMANVDSNTEVPISHIKKVVNPLVNQMLGYLNYEKEDPQLFDIGDMAVELNLILSHKRENVGLNHLVVFYLSKLLKLFETILEAHKIPMLLNTKETYVKYFHTKFKCQNLLEMVQSSPTLVEYFTTKESTYMYILHKSFNDLKNKLHYKMNILRTREKQINYVKANSWKVNSMHNLVLVQKNPSYYNGKYEHRSKLKQEYDFEYTHYDYPYQALLGSLEMDSLENYNLPTYPFVDEIYRYINKDFKEFKGWPRFETDLRKVYYFTRKEYNVLIVYWFWLMDVLVSVHGEALAKFQVNNWVEAGRFFYVPCSVFLKSFINILTKQDDTHEGVPVHYFLDDNARVNTCQRVGNKFFTQNKIKMGSSEENLRIDKDYSDRELKSALSKLEKIYDVKNVIGKMKINSNIVLKRGNSINIDNLLN